jgi:hypothetical protein
MNNNYDNHIATSSIEEGLDFACNLASNAIQVAGASSPLKAQVLLQGLAMYVSLRYAGELHLAAGCLSELGKACEAKEIKLVQFWNQMRWIAKEMNLTEAELVELALPSA